MSRGVNLTEAQLRNLLKQAPKNGQAAKKLERSLYESQIETTIVDAMERDGWRAFKMEYNFDTVKKITLGEPGMCDHLFIRYASRDAGVLAAMLTSTQFAKAEVLWWEFKASAKRRKRREYLSVDQTFWIQAEKAKGALVWIAGIDHEATIDGAAQHYLDSGLARRREFFVALITQERRKI
jgi:hypothetical protein